MSLSIARLEPAVWRLQRACGYMLRCTWELPKTDVCRGAAPALKALSMIRSSAEAARADVSCCERCLDDSRGLFSAAALRGAVEASQKLVGAPLLGSCARAHQRSAEMIPRTLRDMMARHRTPEALRRTGRCSKRPPLHLPPRFLPQASAAPSWLPRQRAMHEAVRWQSTH